MKDLSRTLFCTRVTKQHNIFVSGVWTPVIDFEGFLKVLLPTYTPSSKNIACMPERLRSRYLSPGHAAGDILRIGCIGHRRVYCGEGSFAHTALKRKNVL